MPLHIDLSTLIVLSIVAVSFMFGIGAWVGSLVGRQLVTVPLRPAPRVERRAPERLVRELERCVQLGDCVSRDVDSLSALVCCESPPVSAELAAAISQLIKTTRNLAGRIQRMGEASRLARSGNATKPDPAASTPGQTAPQPVAPRSSAPLRASNGQSATEAELRDSRRFPRSQFRGTAKATIYPSSSSDSAEPIQCTVLTRNLSCGGVGIAHCDRLF